MKSLQFVYKIECNKAKVSRNPLPNQASLCSHFFACRVLSQACEEKQQTNQQTRAAFDKLKSTNKITIRSTNKYSVITVVNRAKYRFDHEESNKQNNEQISNQINKQNRKKQQTKQQQYKKYKEI